MKETLKAAMIILQNSTYGTMGKGCDEELKQETLEEAAKKYWDKLSFQDAFIEGAKWQSERMYSEEDMIKFAFDTYHYISKLMGVPFNQISENKLHAMYNFEQFKKK
jgi:hypothetical protein